MFVCLFVCEVLFCLPVCLLVCVVKFSFIRLCCLFVCCVCLCVRSFVCSFVCLFVRSFFFGLFRRSHGVEGWGSRCGRAVLFVCEGGSFVCLVCRFCL